MGQKGASAARAGAYAVTEMFCAPMQRNNEADACANAMRGSAGAAMRKPCSTRRL
jgi:hypothetical protein